ncbi:hypothetical protein [Flavobacterium sp. NKUCC04_CG]|uniref:hypothetical protein n=1 Tax=Flavobacterium sp. NKUCC04_CG TaxID=2842121 RepID=UPI001C5BD2D3|nr:hypothetical protein [Flavobacterium sp. NKUCC04_CG]MBW3517816.1 hypothetical protein [Flavobacterium sp. NKUCC04_CG]
MRGILFLFLFFSFTAFSQERELLQGKIVSRSKLLSGIYIANVNTGESVLSRKGGYFELMGKANDTLMFSGSLFIGYRRTLDELDLKKEMLFIPLEENDLSYQLSEIMIYKVTAESLGIVPKGRKILTPAERRLYTANSGGGLIPIDMIVNAITGRTKMLKKALKYEQEEMRKEKLLRIFDEKFIRENYGIPDAYVMGFVYNAVSDPEVLSLLNAKGVAKASLQLRLGDLALGFLEMIQEKDKKGNPKN